MLGALGLAAGCGSASSGAAAVTFQVPTADRCVIALHGKGGNGEPPRVLADSSVRLAPSGNAAGWDARQWLYFPDARYDQARQVVADLITAAGCSQVIINGFSNGGAFAAKMFCRGETFGGKVVRYVLDDPVPDGAPTAGCTPPTAVPITLYWTGALAPTATAGWRCSTQDWTCEGGTTVGIQAYAVALGATITPSPFTTHTWYTDAPELTMWRA